jgi:putative methionine-R-sulfoxide reductase with GAF domain
MKRHNSDAKMEPPIPDILAPIAEKKLLHRKTWRNWFFLTGVLILTMIGLITAIPPLLSERLVNPWPWVKTDLVLIIGLSMTVLVFIGYMTQQQRHVMHLHQKLETVQAHIDLKLRHDAERIFALTSMSRIMGVETDLQKIFNAITKICAETFQSDRASLMLRDEENQYLVVKSACGRSSEDILYIRREIGEGIAGWVAKNRKPILLNSPVDYELYPDLVFTDPEINSAMVAPIIVRDELVGVINVSSRSSDIKYESDDLRALQVLADNAGVCIRHTEHINWIKKIAPTLKTAGSKDKIAKEFLRPKRS